MSRSSSAPDPIHAYFASRSGGDDELQREVEFALACGAEYAGNVAACFGRPTLPRPDISGLSLLEIGPGLNFGAALVCAALGARVVVRDKYLVAWRSDYHPAFYQRLRRDAERAMPGADWSVVDRVGADGSGLTAVLGLQRQDLSEATIPETFASESEAYDAVVSNAALEHVPDIDAACSALWRLTRPGGAGVHQVDFRDHSHNDRPLEFLATADADYAASFAASLGGGGNRVRPAEMARAFEGAGFVVSRFDVNCRADEAYVHEARPRLLPRYAALDVEELRIVGGRFFLRRP